MGKQFLILFSLILGLGHSLPFAVPSTCPDSAPTASVVSVTAKTPLKLYSKSLL